MNGVFAGNPYGVPGFSALSEEEALKESQCCLQCGLTCFWTDAELAGKGEKEGA